MLTNLKQQTRHRKLLRKFLCGNWTRDLSNEIRQQALCAPTTANLYLHLQSLELISGFAQADLDEIAALTGKTQFRVISRLLYLYAKKHHPVPPTLLGLVKSAVRPGPLHQYIQTYPLLSETHTGLAEFSPLYIDRWLKSVPNRSFAVVGNGPSQRGKFSGNEIDEHDCVIRFNRRNLSDEYAPDYGRRTNVWVTSPDYVASESEESKQTIRVISGMTPLLRSKKLNMRLYGVDRSTIGTWKGSNGVMTENLILQFSPDTWYDLVSKVEAPPSAGLLTSYTLYKNGSKFDLYGFTTEFSADQKNHYGDTGIRSSRHNWEKEAIVLNSISRSDNAS